MLYKKQAKQAIGEQTSKQPPLHISVSVLASRLLPGISVLISLSDGLWSASVSQTTFPPPLSFFLLVFFFLQRCICF